MTSFYFLKSNTNIKIKPNHVKTRNNIVW